MNMQQQHDLVVRAQAGDSEAIDALFNEYYNNVYYFALKTVKDPELACDITQETFMEIIQTIGDLKEPAAFVTWMKQITYHQCTRYFRKKKDVLLEENEDEEGNSLFDTLADEGAIPQEILEKEEFRQTIMGMIDQLSEEQRSAVLLYYFDELSVPQIAEIQGVSEGTVKSRLNYARKAIKKSVEGYEAKTGVKLHSVAILPLLMLYFGKELMPVAEAAKVHSAIVGAMGTTATAAASAAAGTTTAAAAATTTTTVATATTTAATAAATTATTATTAAATATAAATVTGGALAVKITAGVVMAALAIGSAGIAAGVIPTPWTDQNIFVEETKETEGTKDTEATNPEETVPTIAEDPTIPTEEIYDSNLIGALGDMQDAGEIFADFPSNRVVYFLTKDGKLATRKKPHTEVDFGADADVQECLILGQFPLYKDSQGVYHMYTGTRVIALTNVTGVPVAIKTQGTQDATTGTSVVQYYMVFSLSEGQLYYNRFSVSGEKTDYDNTPVQIIDDSEQGYVVENISWFTEVMNPDNTWSFRMSADGMIYHLDKIPSGIREGEAAFVVEATGVAETDVLCDAGNPLLIYKMPGQENVIYVDGVSINLPEGKTAADVTLAVGVQTGLVFFADGTVCIYDQNGMTYSEGLTELNQQKSIRKVFVAYTSNQNIFMIMDNNMTYTLQ